MYTKFYNLDNRPFEKNPDPSFLWFGEKLQKALATLRYGVLENKGFLLLTGDAGVGKTSLVNALTRDLGEDIAWAVITDPRCERIDFYNAIAGGFGIDKPCTSKVQFLIQFSHFLHRADDENKKVLLLVDDCHLLSQEMLEDLRLLSNIEKADAKLINIFFIGQPPFNEMLLQSKNRAVSQRLALTLGLQPLTVKETDEYIRHRLKISGSKETLFTAKAVQAIHQFAQGIPERINGICDNALEIGSGRRLRSLDRRVIASSVQKINVSVEPDQQEFEAFFDEKMAFKPPGGEIVPGPASISSAISGFAQKSGRQRSWVKYGLVLLTLLLAGIYIWFPASPLLESAPKVAGQGENASAVKVPFPVRSPPAVAMLEKNKSKISDKKALEVKTAILGKSSDDKSAPKKTRDPDLLKSSVGVDADVAKADSEVKPPGTVHRHDPVKELKAHQTKKITTVVRQPAAANLAPLQPRKIVLGLRPNSLKLTIAGEKVLTRFVEKLKLYPRAAVLVKGFVSARSNSPENIKLSEDRARSVQKLMLAKGIAAERIEVMGMGNKEPIASNGTREGRKKNRRVEVIVLDDGT